MLTDGRTDRQTDRRTSSIHKPELLCNPAKNGNHRYKYLVLGREGPYFVKSTQIQKTSTLKMTSLTC